MLNVTADDAVTAWKTAFTLLFERGLPVEFNGFFRNECAAFEISDINGLSYSHLFPMSREEVQQVSEYLISGTGNINHDWTRMYRQRLFESTDHVGNLIRLLKDWPDCPRAQISVWINETDLRRDQLAPCLQLLWFKILAQSLELHIHMRTCDCFGKLLMNFNEFMAIQRYVANELNLNPGKFVLFVDSLHFHERDKAEVCELYKKLATEQSTVRNKSI